MFKDSWLLFLAKGGGCNPVSWIKSWNEQDERPGKVQCWFKKYTCVYVWKDVKVYVRVPVVPRKPVTDTQLFDSLIVVHFWLKRSQITSQGQRKPLNLILTKRKDYSSSSGHHLEENCLGTRSCKVSSPHSPHCSQHIF